MYVCIMALQIICAALLFLTLDMTCHKTNCQEMKMAGNETALQQKLFSDYRGITNSENQLDCFLTEFQSGSSYTLFLFRSWT